MLEKRVVMARYSIENMRLHACSVFSKKNSLVRQGSMIVRAVFIFILSNLKIYHVAFHTSSQLGVCAIHDLSRVTHICPTVKAEPPGPMP